jgi:hypothetical protein
MSVKPCSAQALKLSASAVKDPFCQQQVPISNKFGNAIVLLFQANSRLGKERLHVIRALVLSIALVRTVEWMKT